MICFISLILDILLFNIISRSSYLLPLFTIVSLLFISKNNKYYIITLLLGFLYDLFFNNYYILNMIIFTIITYILVLIYKKIKFNYLNNIIIGIFLITIYQSLLYLILYITRYSLNDFFYIIPHYYLINIIYIIIITFIYKKRLK